MATVTLALRWSRYAALTRDYSTGTAMKGTTVSTNFSTLGVPYPLVEALAAAGKTEAFPIQVDTLPDTLAGRDVLGRGKTGSGKTLAFLLPAFANLAASLQPDGGAAPGLASPRALVLAPTRELCQQIGSVAVDIAAHPRLPCAPTVRCVVGGVDYASQRSVRIHNSAQWSL